MTTPNTTKVGELAHDIRAKAQRDATGKGPRGHRQGRKGGAVSDDYFRVRMSSLEALP